MPTLGDSGRRHTTEIALALELILRCCKLQAILALLLTTPCATSHDRERLGLLNQLQMR